jgi:hypothetical protein
MSRLPTPDRGQPIDVPYLYQIATAVNSLADQIDASSEKNTRISTDSSSIPQDLRTSDAKFFAGVRIIYSQTEVRAGDLKDFVFQISGFKFPPVATVTPVNTGTSSASNDVLVVITSITASEIRGFVRFNSAGNISVSVNVIAIGIPV